MLISTIYMNYPAGI